MGTTKDQVIGAVSDRLRKIGHGLTFEIIEAAVREDGEWWYVPVLVSWTNGRNPSHELLVNAYANVETEVSEQLDANVLLVPAVA